MSDIHGDGYGSAHDWMRLETVPKVTHYICRACKEQFWHAYDYIPQIFLAMKENGVRENCEQPERGDVSHVAT